MGKDGEAFAREFLAGQGYGILEANYRTRTGEIDLVAQQGETIVFIEVKTRQEDGWDAFEAVDRRKQSRMKRTAQAFLMERYGTEDVSARFDVLAVYSRNGVLEADLLKDAFGI